MSELAGIGELLYDAKYKAFPVLNDSLTLLAMFPPMYTKSLSCSLDIVKKIIKNR